MERIAVLSRVGAADAVVGAHHRRDVAILDQHLKWQQIQLAQDVFIDFDTGAETLVFLVVDDVVLAHGDDIMGLDRPGHGHTHDARQIRIFRKIFKIAAGDGCTVQADAGALQHMLAEGRRLGADDIAVVAGQSRVESGREGNRHRQGRRSRAGMAIAHANTDRAIRDPETRDAQLVNALDMALDLELGHQAVLLLRTHRRHLVSRRQGVDIDRVHGAMQLGNFLLKTHGGDELFRALPRGQGSGPSRANPAWIQQFRLSCPVWDGC